MLHKDYHYVECALGGAQNRNNITPVWAMKNVTGYRECYATYYRYNHEMIDHFNEKNTVSGYQGQAYADWLPIDIDSPDLDQAQDNLNRLFDNLEALEVDVNCCRVYFSGAKGFHVMIPSQIFEAVPSIDIHKRFRKLALHIAKGINIDTSIYDKTRIFRLPNTINAKTGLFKVELYPFQSISLPIDEILNMAKNPVERLEIETDFDTNEELKEIYLSPLEQAKPKGNARNSAVKTYICMSELMKGVGEGNRDNVAVRVAAHLRQSGLSPEMVWAALDTWNESNNPPLETYELERVYDQGLRDYEFGCHDFILKEHCNKDCLFYKEHWGRF